MTKQELYDEVMKLVKTDPDPYNQTSLYDWIMDGDTDDMTPQEIATEWDELPAMESDL